MPDPNDLQRICGLLDRQEIDRHRFLEELTRFMARDIGCSRAGVRMLIETPNGPALRSIAMHDAAVDSLVSVPDLPADGTRLYIEALRQDGSVVAPVTSMHPATASYQADYLASQDVQSLLDVGFSVNGTLYGSFSCEQVGSTQAWTPQQLTRLRQIASRVSLTLMHAVSADIDTTPGALWEPSSPNRLTTMALPLTDEEGNIT